MPLPSTVSSNDSPNDSYYQLFERCNRTELYQVARANGHHVLPNFSREALITCILEEEAPLPPTYHTIDEWRRAIMRFICDHRAVLTKQLTCQAQSFELPACDGCTDTQVLSCVTSNGEANFQLIQLRKKNDHE